jgi:hypothetical protein
MGTVSRSGVTFPAWRAEGGSIPLVELLLAVGPWVLGPVRWSVGDCEFSSGSRGSTRLAELASSRARLSTLELVDLVADQVQLVDGEVGCFEDGSDVPFLTLTSVRGDDWDVCSTGQGPLDVMARTFPGCVDFPAEGAGPTPGASAPAGPELLPGQDSTSPSATPPDAWLAVLEADRRLNEALSAFPPNELRETLARALTDFSSRRTALRVLRSAHPSLTSGVLPAVEPLLLVSHSLLDACRALVLRLPSAERIDFLQRLTTTVVDDDASDYEAYRRLAELLRVTGASDALAVLVRAASRSADPDIKEVEEDFSPA